MESNLHCLKFLGSDVFLGGDSLKQAFEERVNKVILANFDVDQSFSWSYKKVGDVYFYIEPKGNITYVNKSKKLEEFGSRYLTDQALGIAVTLSALLYIKVWSDNLSFDDTFFLMDNIDNLSFMIDHLDEADDILSTHRKFFNY